MATYGIVKAQVSGNVVWDTLQAVRPRLFGVVGAAEADVAEHVEQQVVSPLGEILWSRPPLTTEGLTRQ